MEIKKDSIEKSWIVVGTCWFAHQAKAWFNERKNGARVYLVDKMGRAKLFLSNV